MVHSRSLSIRTTLTLLLRAVYSGDWDMSWWHLLMNTELYITAGFRGHCAAPCRHLCTQIGHLSTHFMAYGRYDTLETNTRYRYRINESIAMQAVEAAPWCRVWTPSCAAPGAAPCMCGRGITAQLPPELPNLQGGYFCIVVCACCGYTRMVLSGRSRAIWTGLDVSVCYTHWVVAGREPGGLHM